MDKISNCVFLFLSTKVRHLPTVIVSKFKTQLELNAYILTWFQFSDFFDHPIIFIPKFET